MILRQLGMFTASEREACQIMLLIFNFTANSSSLAVHKQVNRQG